MTETDITRRRRPAHAARVTPQPRFTRLRALLAGGLVLGVGATLTLAAWTDQEFAKREFTASVFGIVGSTDGVNFSDHGEANQAALVFSPSVATLAPGLTTYAKFAVRTSDASTVGGNVLLGGATASGALAPHLTYGVAVVPAAGPCNDATFAAGTKIVTPGSTLSTAGQPAQGVQEHGASTVAYCFGVSLSSATPNEMQGQTAVASWRITATSQE